MSTVAIFNNASQAVLKLTKIPTDEEKLVLYGFFKQATIGDINIPQPSLLGSNINYLKDTSKWNAWNKNKGLSKQNAMIRYIKFVSELLVKYN